MARDGNGTYSLPAGSTITNGETSDASDINTPLQDIETDLNTARPIVAGGTGATTAANAVTNLGFTVSAANISTRAGAYHLADITVLTSGTAATYTTPANARALRVTLVGGGGGGGGVDGQGTGTCGVSAGGSGGAYGVLWITSPEASYTYTIGAGGAGGASGNNSGSSGGDTTFAGAVNTATAGGAEAGNGDLAASGITGGSPRNGGDWSASGFTVVAFSSGAPAEWSRGVNGDLLSIGNSGAGPWGGSERSLNAATDNGINATSYGAGGGGVYVSNVADNGAGGDGGDGVIIVEVFF